MIIHPGLIASEFFITVGNHSFRVWLWETDKDLARWAERYSCERVPGAHDDAQALFSPGYNSKIHAPVQHLGELHFVKNQWDEETVGHELCHLLFQYIRMVVEDFVRPLYRYYKEWMEWEEEICYPFGEWCQQVTRWLWKKNPNEKRARVQICEQNINSVNMPVDSVNKAMKDFVNSGLLDT